MHSLNVVPLYSCYDNVNLNNIGLLGTGIITLLQPVRMPSVYKEDTYASR